MSSARARATPVRRAGARPRSPNRSVIGHGVTERHQGGVDAVLQRGPVADEVQPETGSLAFGAHRGRGQPDLGHEVAAGELGQHPGSILSVLAARGARPFTFVASAIRHPSRRTRAARGRSGRRSSTRSPCTPGHRTRRSACSAPPIRPGPGPRWSPPTAPRLVHHVDIKSCSTQVQPDVHHDNRPPSDTLLVSTSKRASGGGPRLHDIQFWTLPVEPSTAVKVPPATA